MSDVLTVYRKELRSYFVGPIAWIVMAFFVLAIAYRFYFMQEFFLYDQASMQRLFGGLEQSGIIIILVPALSMRLWSEEIRSGTMESLMTSSISSTSMVLGKFFAGWTVISIAILLTLPLPITVDYLGDLDWGPVLGAYLGLFLIAGAYLAIGTWISSRTKHQTISFLLTAFIGGLFILIQRVAATSQVSFASVLNNLSLTKHYQAMGRGVIDLRDVAYFVSFILFFLYLNVQSVENRRYT